MKLQTKVISLAGLTLAACSHPKEQQPNVIYIFADQFRQSSLGYWQQEPYSSAVRWVGDPVITPNLDQFADQSVVLTNAVSTCPVSSPHRGMLLSGMYPERNGVTLNCMAERPESTLREDAECISDVFSQAGYDCAYIGKLHVDFPTPNNPQAPGTYVSDRRPEWDAYTPKERRHGFNYWYSYGTFDEHKNPHYWDSEGNRHDPKEWSVEHETDRAIDYILNKSGERDSSKPFFMMLSYNPPHSPYNSLDDCMEQDYNLYAQKSLAELYVRANADTTMLKAPSMRYYMANVTGVDRQFGRILSTLKELGIVQNTIVVFTSDHGETMCSHSLQDPKNSIFSESFNTPFMVRYPNHLKPRIDSVLLSTTDIMPTLLSLAGLGGMTPSTVEGQDLSSALRGEESAQRPSSALYMRNLNGERDSLGLVRGIFPEARGLKTSQYTFEMVIGRDLELKSVMIIDDYADPYQLSPISVEQNPELYAELCRELGRKLKESNDIWYRERILDQIVKYE